MKQKSFSTTAHATLGKLLLVTALAVAVLALLPPRLQSAAPPSGTLSPTSQPINWDGTASGVSVQTDEGNCEEGVSCDTFVLTLSGQPSDWTGKVARVDLRWMLYTTDYDFYVHQGSLTGPVVASSTGTMGTTISETADIDPSEDGTGAFYVHVVYFQGNPADQYHGTATVASRQERLLPPAPVASGVAPRFQVHTPTLQQIAAGIGVDAGEPSIGSNWKSGAAMFQSFLQTLRVRFNDSCRSTPSAIWEDKSAPTSQESLDPILFTDSPTGRTFVSQLTGQDSLSSVSDDDGDNWVPSQGGGIPSGVDHQTVGGGPFHAPLTRDPNGLIYPNAFYYCSQSDATAFCARSDDGGLTFGPGVPAFTVNDCWGLHGHAKVAPDGAVYVPNRACGGTVLALHDDGNQAVVVSEDNGITWNVRLVPGTIASGSDPSVAIDKGGRVYLGFANADEQAGVAVSDDHGQHWSKLYNVGASLGLHGVAFPTMIAGDAGRAAMAFFGTTGQAPFEDLPFRGVWHLYIATTYDGGDSWFLSDATPNDPIQLGALWLGGGGPVQRNLLDFFDSTVDKEGRVLVGYDDGCIGPCSQAAPTAIGNSYSSLASIARQTGGKRLFAQFDPPQLQTEPGAPALVVTRNGWQSRLTWSESETGGSPIQQYRVYRTPVGGSEQLLATVGTQTQYIDQFADPTLSFVYRVTATNALGSSCGSDAVQADPVGESCALPGIKVASDPTEDQVGAPQNADLDIQSISIAEPANVSDQLVFTMKVADLSTIPPNRQWRIIWAYPKEPASGVTFEGYYYAGMNSDASSNVTFEYGTVTNDVPLLVSTFTPHRQGAAEAGSGFLPDGTIHIALAKNKVGSPVAGDLLGSLFGRTFAGQGNQTMRSTAAADSATVTDTYGLLGNIPCFLPPLTPISVVSRKTHGSAGEFDIDLPLGGTVGIEDRSGGADRSYKVVITFPLPVTVTNVTVTPAPGKSAHVSSYNVNGSVVTVHLDEVGNAQTISIKLSGLSDGTNTGNLFIPMGMLLGDTTADGFANSADIAQTKSQSGQSVTGSNFREDVTTDGNINSADIALVKSKSGTGLP